ncbi:MAG: site-2 protease family protein [Candidatus Nomurabacteria bacterium]|nr:MAG: site-2 protease family protein [Candidatus Nomurabacteria bacterium]
MILDLLFTDPAIFLIYLGAIIVPIALHEFAHALSATMQGDPTPKAMGRLTFNPLAHIDPMGILLLLIAGFGWGKPTPFNPINLKNPRLGTVWVALAGPLSNLIQIIVFGIFLKFVAFLGPSNYLVIFLAALLQINIILMLFNLIPIPPLDGSKVLFGFLPPSTLEFQARFERIGPLVLLGIIIVDQFTGIGVFHWIFSGITNAIFSFF